MARDLIPPKSPAGRPSPDGEARPHSLPDGVPHLIELPPEPPRSPAQPSQQESPYTPSQFRNRFGFLMGSLAGVFVAAVLVTAAVILWGGSGSGASEQLYSNWSPWHPADDSADAGAQEIAEKVSSEYKQANGQQLVKVTGQPLPVPVALQTAGLTKSFGGENGVMFVLDGLGPNGSIKDGKPSTQRQQLMRREALELALYTFRYLPSVDTVVALMPPPPPTAQDTAATAAAAAAGIPNTSSDTSKMTAMFYRPGDLKGQLQIPLTATLAPHAPAPERMGGAEGTTVDQLTLSNIFNWQVSADQVGQPRLVLSPLPTK